MILGGGAEHEQGMKVLGIQSSKTWYSKKFKVSFNKKIWVSIRSNEIGLEDRYYLKTLLAALSRVSKWLVTHINFLLFLLTHSTSASFFMLAISTRVCDCGSSSTTFSETFTVVHFVVKPTIQ